MQSFRFIPVHSPVGINDRTTYYSKLIFLKHKTHIRFLPAHKVEITQFKFKEIQDRNVCLTIKMCEFREINQWDQLYIT